MGPVGRTFGGKKQSGYWWKMLADYVQNNPFVPPTTGATVAPIDTIDVKEWRGRIDYKNVAVTASGDFSCETERRVCMKFEVSLSLSFDVAEIAELKLHNGAGVQAWLKVGDEDLSYPNWLGSNSVQKFYYTPKMLLSAAELANPAAGMVGQQFRGRGSGIFLLPDESRALTTYWQYLQQAGWDGR